MNTRKIIASFLTPLMLIGSAFAIAGCKGKSTGEGQIISKDDPWFTTKEVHFNDICDAGDYSEIAFEGFQFEGDYILVNCEAHNFSDEGYITIGDYITCILDQDGELISRLSSTDIVGESDKAFTTFLGCIAENGDLYCYLNHGGLCKAKIDPETGKPGSVEKVELGSGNISYIECMSVYGDYGFIFAESGSSYEVLVIKDGELVLEKDLKSEFATDYVYVSGISGNDSKVTLYISYSGGLAECEYDIKSNDFKKVGDSIFSRPGNVVQGFDGRYYSDEGDGVYVDGEPFCLFGDSDGNLKRLSDAKLGSVMEDRVILYGDASDTISLDQDPVLYILVKQAENPNAGKTLIKAYSSYSMVDEMIAEGIKQFNAGSDKYYIRTQADDAYNDPDFDMFDSESYQKYEDEFKLKVLSDDGPDIIFNADNISGLENDNCLIDLSKDIKLDPDKYYATVEECAVTNGKLYSLPLNFYFEGIITDKSYVKEGTKGFTFDEYEEFVSTTCNGENPLCEEYSKEDLLVHFVCSSYNSWIKDGKVDFDHDEFRKMASYTKDNIPDQANLEDENGVVTFDDGYLMNQAKKKASCMSVYDLSFLIRFMPDMKDPVLLGLPSTEGKGLTAHIETTVSLTASCKNKDACLELINILLSPEIQKLSSCSPMNKEAAEYLIDKTISALNAEYEKRRDQMGYTNEMLGMMGLSEVPYELRKVYLDALENIDGVGHYDLSVTTILREESRAYFSGQKDIDSFIGNLENRVQTVINEQG